MTAALAELTVASPPKESLHTQYGTISYHEWLLNEELRLKAQGRTVEIRKGKKGISLWANDLTKKQKRLKKGELRE